MQAGLGRVDLDFVDGTRVFDQMNNGFCKKGLQSRLVPRSWNLLCLHNYSRHRHNLTTLQDESRLRQCGLARNTADSDL